MFNHMKKFQIFFLKFQIFFADEILVGRDVDILSAIPHLTWVVGLLLLQLETC